MGQRRKNVVPYTLDVTVRKNSIELPRTNEQVREGSRVTLYLGMESDCPVGVLVPGESEQRTLQVNGMEVIRMSPLTIGDDYRVYAPSALWPEGSQLTVMDMVQSIEIWRRDEARKYIADIDFEELANSLPDESRPFG